MARPTRIHIDKQPIRFHFIPEWAEKRGKTQADLSRATGADKSNVSRWWTGTIPRKEHLAALIVCLALEDDPTAIFRHPDKDWMFRLLRGRSEDEERRIQATIEAAFPRQKAI